MQTPAPEDRPTVAIAGATGFIGTAVRRALADRFRIVSLTRSPVRARENATPGSGEEWRHCDLFDPYAVRQALDGADYALYLVHSMHPSSRLTQADAADLDLLLADNFARAAESRGVRQILYVGGLVPDGVPEAELPSRLRSRLEVERTLGSGRVPVTTLRAGLIVGPGGTWLRLLLNLVHRLPAMILPAWTDAFTQPVALEDVVRGLTHCLANPETYGGVYDVGGPERMTYRQMLERTARVLGVHRPMLTVPFDSSRISKLWVRAFGSVPGDLVGSIVDTLRYQARVRPNPLQAHLKPDALSFEAALEASIDDRGRPLPNPRAALRPREDAIIRSESVARSVQRLPLPNGFTAHDVANEYMRWLPRFGWPVLRCSVRKGRVARFQVRPFGWTLLELSFAADRSPQGRQLFYVTDGLLADMTNAHTGRLEFRRALDGRSIIAAVHDFAPTLPWYVYNSTQALAHLFVMNRFGRHLQKIADRRSESGQPALQGG